MKKFIKQRPIVAKFIDGFVEIHHTFFLKSIKNSISALLETGTPRQIRQRKIRQVFRAIY